MSEEETKEVQPEATKEEEKLAENEEIHVLNAGGFVPGLPGLYGQGTRIVVDKASGQPLRALSAPVPPERENEVLANPTPEPPEETTVPVQPGETPVVVVPPPAEPEPPQA